ncbi:MAG: hypothetical protein F9K40_10805 [Kofleriaceae bacterium]|nr:MAG: hypothetical protein F9K40_10805 [Kofleriaceae bacterium]MBZ0235086.1 hypothetical protein [Kofleriaceae bacterium]
MSFVPSPDDLRAALDPVADAFEALGIGYRVGGSVASSALGVARSTLDIDVVADLRGEHVEPLVERLGADYYIDADAIRDAIRRRSSFNLIHLASMMKVDIFVLKTREFDRQAFARATDRQVGDGPPRPFPMTTAEDIILHKLEWYRLGNEIAQRQWDDILGVLRLQSTTLDRAYLEHWARELGIDDLLARALAEAGLG